MAVANEELDESYLESLESSLADELSFTFDFEQLDSKDLGGYSSHGLDCDRHVSDLGAPWSSGLADYLYNCYQN